MADQFPEYCWRDVAIGDLTKRNRVVLSQEVAAAVPAHRRECYATICRFTDEFRDYVKKTGSVKRFEGPAFADFLWFDIDETDLADAQEAALVLVLQLVGFWQVEREDLRLYFSGSKGFHVGIPSASFGAQPSEAFPKILSTMARRIAAQAGVTIDLSLYQPTRLLRLPSTINQKSGLYKVALNFGELDDLEAILTRAKDLPARRLAYPKLPTPNEVLARLYRACLEDVEKGEAGKKELPVLPSGHMAETPKHDKICIASLMIGVPNGSRNEACMRIAVHLRQKGMPLPMALAACLEWNRHNQTPLDDMEVQTTLRSAYEGGYEYGCWDELLDRHCDRKCYLWAQKMKGRGDLAEDLLTAEELAERYMQSIKQNLDGKVTWGVEWLDLKTRGLYPGQVGMILARAGVGKTALVINTLAANSAARIPALFVSLEQLGAEVFERMAQNATEMTGEAIETGFGTGDLSFIGSVKEMVGGRFSKVLVCDKSSLTITQLKAYIDAASSKLGEKVRLLCVDYFGLIRQEGFDAYQKATEIARGLKEVAKDTGVAVICIVQLNRTAGKGAVEVEMNMARDAGTIEEAADIMVGMWRASGDEEGASHGVSVSGPNGGYQTVQPGPGYYPVYVKLLKNRKGADDERIALMFRASVMRFESIDWRPKPREARDSDFG